MQPTRHPLTTQTPDFALSAGYQLWVFCPACRVNRPGDLLALSVAGRGRHPIAGMRFKCKTCGGLGTPYLSGTAPGGDRVTFGLD